MSRRDSSCVSLLLACVAFSVATHAVAQAPGSSQPVGGSPLPESSAPLAGGPPSEQRVLPNATVVQPRAFGYVVGDMLTQRVLLELDGREFEPAELPSPGRVGVWFERRAARVEEEPSGRRWLSVDYQLMNSPQALRVVTLPAWKIKPADAVPRGSSGGISGGASGKALGGASRNGASVAEAGELRIAEWPISVGPLTSERADARPGLGSLQPDRRVPLIALAPIERGLGVGIAGLILTALAWVAWLFWRNWRASAAQPFARAMFELRGVDGQAPEAWHALHRAFDATAGRVMRTDTLPELFRRAPHLVPLRAQIEEFFRESAARFFAGAPAGRDLSPQLLCRELRRIEKRHER